MIRTIWPISTKLGTKQPWVKGTEGFANKDLSIIKKGDDGCFPLQINIIIIALS